MTKRSREAEETLLYCVGSTDPMINVSDDARCAKRVKELIEMGASLGVPELHLAAKYNKIKTMDVLIDHGMDVNAKECVDRGDTPMMFAVQRDEGDRLLDNKALRRLILHGADINAKNDYKQTALHLAVDHGDYASVRVLLENGADVFARDHNGRIPADYGVCMGDATLEDLKITEILVREMTEIMIKNNTA